MKIRGLKQAMDSLRMKAPWSGSILSLFILSRPKLMKKGRVLVILLNSERSLL